MSRKGKKNIDWSNQPLGTMSDTDLAKKLGCVASAVFHQRQRRGIPRFKKCDWSDVPLGKIPDCEVAKLVGCSAALVNRRRREKGIPRCDLAAYHGEAWKDRWKERWKDVPLGKFSDGEVAKLTGLTRQRIHQVRISLGIPSWSSQKQEKQP